MKKTAFYTLLMAGALALPHPAPAAETTASAHTTVGAEANTGLLARAGSKIRGLFSSDANVNARVEPAAGAQVTTDTNLEAMRRGNEARAARAQAQANAEARAAAQTHQDMEARARTSSSASSSDEPDTAATTMDSAVEADVNADIQSSTGVNVGDIGVGSRNNNSLGASGGVDLSVGGGGLQ